MTFGEYRAALAALPAIDESLLVFARVDSTNGVALRLLRRLRRASPRLTVAALEQTAGRGRHGRPWISLAGSGLYVSLLRLVRRSELAAVPMLAGVGLAAALRRVAGVDCRLKWPNDLLVGGRKLGGVLVEAVSRGHGRPIGTVIGFGINVSQSRAQLEPLAATSIALETGVTPSLAVLTAALVASVDAELAHAAEPGYAVARFTELMVHRLGEPLTCRIGPSVLAGSLAGFDPRGLLRLRVGGRDRLLAAADLESPGEAAC